MRPFDPEPSIEPREPEVYDYCIFCGGEIYKGESCAKTSLGSVCHSCADEFAFKRVIAGEEVSRWAAI